MSIRAARLKAGRALAFWFCFIPSAQITCISCLCTASLTYLYTLYYSDFIIYTLSFHWLGSRPFTQSLFFICLCCSCFYLYVYSCVRVLELAHIPRQQNWFWVWLYIYLGDSSLTLRLFRWWLIWIPWINQQYSVCSLRLSKKKTKHELWSVFKQQNVIFWRKIVGSSNTSASGWNSTIS